MQGGVSTIVNPFAMRNDVFRKKLSLGGLNQSSVLRQGGTARCLFGPPNSVSSKEMAHKIQSKQAWSFERKWNFDVTGKSQPATCLQSSTNPTPVHQWDDVYDQDTMAKCDRHRFEVPTAPNTKPVTLLYAPTVQPEEDRIASSTVESVAVQTESPVMTRFLVQESVSVQTEPANVKMQMDQETQIYGEDRTLVSKKLNKCQLSLSVISCSSGSEESEIYPEDMSPPVPVKKERRLPMPLTIPTSPDDVLDEQFEEHLTSPTDDPTSASGLFLSSPPAFHSSLRRRNTIEIFAFPPLESPSGGFKCLRIRNGSPGLPRSGCKKLKQRSITEYMQVKKTKMSCAKKI